ncbi:MAG TPA: helix-turn-helix domain-containing protein [Thermoanaerobaculia bacterium]|nr:helix-turn-helix domain-containing protein [Thermoanaerobaculia bacterium]
MTEKRTYNLGRRAETAAETRQRLVEATSALHNARGVSAVSLRDIAEEAGVSVGTAYHHFPTYLDAVRACAAHHAVVSALPPETIFDGTRGVEARVRLFVRELCGWYERHSWLERIRAERSSYPPIEEAMMHIAAGIEQLARTAARCTAEEARTIAALSDVAVFSALRRGGMSPTRAINRMTEAVLAWLRSRNSKRRRA